MHTYKHTYIHVYISLSSHMCGFWMLGKLYICTYENVYIKMYISKCICIYTCIYLSSHMCRFRMLGIMVLTKIGTVDMDVRVYLFAGVVSHIWKGVWVTRLNELVSAGNRGSSRVCVCTIEEVVSHVSMRACVARLNAFKISRLLKIIGLFCKRAL